MAQTGDFIHSEDIHPIDIVETVANHRAWDFDRLAEDQIAMAVEGQWRSYSLTLSWSGREEVLRLICTFDMDPPAERLPALYEVLNLANDQVWDGGFTFWAAQKLMVWRYGLVLSGDAMASPEQIDQMIRTAIENAERFYPCFQLACWGDATPEAALDIAMSAAYGRA
ncbi:MULTISPECIES: YbjN domain-containing protein [unclassified Paracoccus (in: a-proteobacteria)]|uniref:YbjN domain-containing protein n=1 Tax=unclassified Paracoccus (in: a-proteobacteria) TaxID=2688777 RepID=UPI0012B1FEA0|nr:MULTISPECIES: YbjN domain-containing protein [unclassified Paracoccus (in: a-proteobacteria)]UXU75173.1 YbjN domain-containing protein [Paracoccus sp. SMMA_5]UXU81075.1 YbjN domain-containing protein [Paracoccus sp. SMMA_5_TC]